MRLSAIAGVAACVVSFSGSAILIERARAPVEASLTSDPWTRAERQRQRALDIADRIAHHEFTTAWRSFDAPLKAQLAPDQLEQAWVTFGREVGPVTVTRDVRMEHTVTFDAAYVRLTTAKGSFDLKMVFQPSGSIGGLFIVPATSPTGLR